MVFKKRLHTTATGKKATDIFKNLRLYPNMESRQLAEYERADYRRHVRLLWTMVESDRIIVFANIFMILAFFFRILTNAKQTRAV